MDKLYDLVILIMSGSGVFGGGERVILRMARWLRERCYRTVVLYNDSAMIVPELLEQLRELGVEFVTMPDMGIDRIPDFTKAYVACPPGSGVKIISIHTEYNFLAAQMLQNRLDHCQCDVVHYVIHQDEFSRFRRAGVRSFGFVSSLLRRYYRRLVEGMERNGNIIYCLAEYAEHVHDSLKISDVKGTVVPLGMDAEPFDEESLRRRYHEDSFLIVATARLEFPEKGFLLGLVDEFEAILAKRPEARLVIVGDGPHKTEMEAKVAASPAAKAIEMVGNLPYEELIDCINKANLYISNGSGPLDAARSGHISVVANYFTTECLTTGYWCDDPDNLGYHGTIPVREMILKTMDMSEAEYLELAHRTYDTFLCSRGMDHFMEQMLVKRNLSEKPLLSRGYLLRSKWLRMLMNIGIKLFK